MSRIGEKPIEVPGGVKVSINGTLVEASGPKGALQLTLPEGIQATLDGTTLSFSRENDSQKAFHGLARSLVANMIEGVNNGYTKELEIQGVGFRAALSGKTLSLSLGFASPIEYPVPDSVTIAVNNNTEVVVSGADKQQVGETAARIRSFFPAEPYKGKGIRYKGEQVRRKVGKTVA
jgi:large subunit ribosomal protein L6